MFKIITVILAAITTLGLTGCASIVNGTNQSVSINTGQVRGATCSLENNKGKWYIPRTPGSVVVNRSFNDLKIQCEKHGDFYGYKSVASKTKAMALGNAIFGGVVGAGVDVVDGAAYDYPSDIYVSMQKGRA